MRRDAARFMITPVSPRYLRTNGRDHENRDRDHQNREGGRRHAEAR
jgi:hypothetical protein